MACDVCNFYFLFWAIFHMFTPPPATPLPVPGDIILQMCPKNYDYMIYCS